MSQFFTSSGHSIGVSALASVLPMNIQDWFPLGWTSWNSLQSKELSRVFSNTTVQKHQFFGAQLLYNPNLTSIHDHWKNHSTDQMDLCWQSNWLCLFNIWSKLVIAFLPRSKCLLVSWLQSPSTVILEPPKIKSITVSIVSLSICHGVMGPDAMILVFWMLSFKSNFSFSSFTFIKRLFISSSLSAVRVVSSAYLRLLMFLPEIFIPAQSMRWNIRVIFYHYERSFSWYRVNLLARVNANTPWKWILGIWRKENFI